MTKKNIQYCSLGGLGRTTALRAQGQCGFDDVVGSGASRAQGGRRCYGPGDDVIRRCRGIGMASGAQHRGLGEDNVVMSSGTAL
jgi:hypothetical protein